MHKIISDLFLLTTNLTQLKNRKRVVDLFIKGVSAIFDGALVLWHEENQENNAALIPVCTRKKTYGYIETDNQIQTNDEGFPYFQNAVQLLAIILERIEQEKALEEHQKQLKDVIYQQTRDLIEKHDELTEANEELSVTNEELTESNRSLIEANNDLEHEIEKREEVERKLRDSDKFFNHASDMLCIAGFDGYFKVMNPVWEKVLGWSRDEMLSKPWIEFVHPDDADRTENIKITIIGGEQVYSFENRFRCKNGEYKWLSWNSYPQPEENLMFGVARDITSVKESEQRLKQIEWMLDTNSKDVGKQIHEPFYGDLTKLNNNGLIINTIDKNDLRDIANDYLSLLETSSAIYEKNGDYALGIFSSGWCRYLDSASRKLCNTKSNQKALESGKWLCHESCWKASQKAIKSGRIVEEKCIGGLNIYARPIKVSGEIVGAINFGYSDPPKNETELRELAEKYQVDYTELAELSQSYESRPPFIVELAKKRLKYSAKQIGTRIESNQIKNQLRESEEKYRRIADNVTDVVWVTDLEMKPTYISPSVERVFGVKPDDFLKLPITKIYPPASLEKFRKKLVEEFENEKDPEADKDRVLELEVERYYSDGTIGWDMVSAKFIRDEYNKPVAIQGVSHDISERKKAEQELVAAKERAEESRSKLKEAQQIARMGNWQLNIETNELFWSDEIYRIFDCEPQEFNATYEAFLKFIHPDDREKVNSAYLNSLETKTDYQIEHRLITKTHQIKYVREKCTTTYNEQGKPLISFGIVIDITEQKALENDLLNAKERAEESDRLKSSFLANMSHEIRTPMNSIMGFASLLPEEESKELMINYANIIVKNSEQLVHIIDDIVLYSRLQTRLLQNIPTEFSACDLMSDIKQSFNLPEFKEKGIELQGQNLTGQVCMVKTDYDKMRQIFTNLISNAFKYTYTGRITFGIKYIDNELCFFVKDTGVGIPNGEIDKVFNRFYRGSNVVQGSIGGTGLGLSIVKELVELLGGRIWVESTEGKGSTFYFTINSNEAE